MIYILVTFVPPDTRTMATFSHFFEVPYGTTKEELENIAEGWLSESLSEGFHDSRRATRGGRLQLGRPLDYEVVIEPTLALEA